MRLQYLIWIVFIIQCYESKAQVSINTDGSFAHSSAMLEVKSTTKGFLTPRMTSIGRDAISLPAEGLIIYNTDDKSLEVFNGIEWKIITGGFRCGISQIEDDEGNRYNTIQIGTQCWMAENLNIGIQLNSSSDPGNNSTIERYCYDDMAGNCNTYGGLYKWDEMMQYVTAAGTQGICPHNWHIPTDDEWTLMINYLGDESTAGGSMKTTGFYDDDTGLWYAPNNGATNLSGFSGQPGGYFSDWGSSFNNINANAYFWTSTLWDSDPDYYARGVGLSAASVGVQRIATGERIDAYSVRCLMD